MRVRRPSRFAVVVLLVLLLICSVVNAVVSARVIDSYYPRGHNRPSVYTREKLEAGQHWWPTVPDFDPPFEEPTSWERTDVFFHTKYVLLLGDGKLNYGDWIVLRDEHVGIPFTAISAKEVRSVHSHGSSTLWPPVLDGSMYGPPAVTYHPLGLILNPIIYALLAWLVLMGVRWMLLTRRARKRERQGLCVSCGYAMDDLSVCPECGAAGQ